MSDDFVMFIVGCFMGVLLLVGVFEMERHACIEQYSAYTCTHEGEWKPQNLVEVK